MSVALAALSEEEARDAARLYARIRTNTYMPVQPHPGPQSEFLCEGTNWRYREVLYGGAAGGGKAGRCPDRAAPSYNEGMETKVLTPKGFKLLGDIHVGDAVCNPDGTVARVIGVHDRGIQPFYRVTFSDGSSVEASADHLWVVSIAGARKRRKKAVPVLPLSMRPEDEWNLRVMQRCTVVTTRDLIDMLGKGNRAKECGLRAYMPQVPLTAPVMLTGAKGRWPQFPPYTLGALIGDGRLDEREISITCVDGHVIERIRQDLDGTFRVMPKPTTNEAVPAYRIVGAQGQKTDTPQAFLRRDGLLNTHSWDKFVPDRIKYAPPDVRFAFIQGLFDTDGSRDEAGGTEVVTVSERLARDTQWMLRSLGYKAKLSTKTPHYTHRGEYRQGRLAYRLYVRGPHQERLFSLPRKVERARVFNGGHVWPAHRLVSIEPTAHDYARCISVDHPNNLYVTDDFIVTHNSIALLLAALQYVDVPGYNAVIVRQTYTALDRPDSIMGRAKDWLRPHPDVEWNERRRTFTFPTGATLSFGYFDDDKHQQQYQGLEFQFIGIDEVGQLQEAHYRYLFSRLRRREGMPVPLRVRATSNPGTPWVKERFVAGGYEKVQAVHGEAERRLFIPARIADNPSLDIAEYRRSLWYLPPVAQLQLLEGDWDVKIGGLLFERTWFPVMDAAPPMQALVRFWDLAGTRPNERNQDPDWTVGILLGQDERGAYWVLDVKRIRETPQAVEDLVKVTALSDGLRVPVRLEQEPGSSGVNTVNYYVTHVLPGFDVAGIRPTGSKDVRAMPVSSQAQVGNVRVLRGAWNAAFFDEIEVFPTPGVHDDQVDAMSSAFSFLAGPRPRATVWI